MSEDREMLGARVPSELKQLVDADPRTNQEIVEAALWREFGGKRKGAIERRIDELRERKSVIQSEVDARQEELDELGELIESLRQDLESAEEDKREKVRNAAETMNWLPPGELTQAITENWASNTGLAPSEFKDLYKEVWSDAEGD